MNNSTLIIAEAGVNHNGDIDLALELVDKAGEAGADVVKFQTFKGSKIAAASASKAAYQKATTDGSESQLAMLTRLELPPEAHYALLDRCAARGITFMSTAGETDSLRFLAEDLKLRTIKLGSGELTNAPLLLAAARSGVRLILSTGMGTISEIETALGVLAFGMLHADDAAASRQAFADAMLQAEAWDRLRARIALLHCTTEYPAAAEDANLRAMETMRRAFGLEVGYSDHSEGNAVSIAAVALGASIIEKHFTLDRTLQGPDHAASVEPHELAELVRGIRQVERALGNGVKQPSASEVPNRTVVRRSLVAARDLEAGHVLTHGDLAVKRPGHGLSPVEYWDCIGRRLNVAVARDGTIGFGALA